MSYAPRDTNPPRDTSPPTEPTGPIASDSLAADSLRSGGDFAASDPSHPQPLGVKGASSTLANTDTSGAEPLPPASSGAARERAELKGLGPDERGHTGVKYPDAEAAAFEGTTTSEGGYYGGPSDGGSGGGAAAAGASDFGGAGSSSSTDGPRITSSTSATKVKDTNLESGPPAGAGVRPHVDAAPNYAGRVSGAISSEGEFQPKGEDLTEGGIPETKTFTGNVGGASDPGRIAEERFEKINANVAGGGASAGRGAGETDQGQFGVLDSERA